MANIIITADVIAKRSLAHLVHNTVFAQLVDRDYEAEFAGKVGDTITVRTPPVFQVKEFSHAQGIEIQDITEGSYPVTIDKHLDISFAVSSREMTLEVDEFSKRFLNPAMQAFAQDIDGRIAEALVDCAEGAGGGGTAGVTGGKPRTALSRAKAILGRNLLPTDERFAVLSPEGAEVLGNDDVIERADASGSTNALRENLIGRIKGFDTYESSQMGFGPGDKGQADGVAFHRSSVALVTRTLEKPLGASDANCSIVNADGFGLRVYYGYDQGKKDNIVSIDLLIGVQSVPSRRKGAVQLDFGQGS